MLGGQDIFRGRNPEGTLGVPFLRSAFVVFNCGTCDVSLALVSLGCINIINFLSCHQSHVCQVVRDKSICVLIEGYEIVRGGRRTTLHMQFYLTILSHRVCNQCTVTVIVLER